METSRPKAEDPLPITAADTILSDRVYVIVPRRDDETEAEWLKRCVVVKNIGEVE